MRTDFRLAFFIKKMHFRAKIAEFRAKIAVFWLENVYKRIKTLENASGLVYNQEYSA